MSFDTSYPSTSSSTASPIAPSTDPHFVVRASRKQYICPGETHPISRSVHLARLSAYYPACRDCPLRTDLGQLSVETKERLESTQRRVARPSLFTDEGIRGVHLNELTRPRAAEMAAAFAHLLWDEFPIASIGNGSPRGTFRASPAVVIGHDERSSAQDLVSGVVSSLRRMGCRVTDVRLVTAPAFRFAVDHLRAQGGIFVTGSGCDPSWIGLDFVRAGGRPLSRGDGLESLEVKSAVPHDRPTRHGGTYRTFQADVPYEAGLWKHFHALRPLRVVCASPVRAQRRLLTRLFERMPCSLEMLSLPVRRRDVHASDDPDIRRVAAIMRDEQAHVGIVIDDDGQTCGFVDERGELVPAANVTRLIAEVILSETPAARIAIEQQKQSGLNDSIAKLGGEPVEAGTTQSRMWQSIADGAVFGGGESGRHWFDEPFPTSDAILTLARALQALSRSDAPFSTILA